MRWSSAAKTPRRSCRESRGWPRSTSANGDDASISALVSYQEFGVNGLGGLHLTGVGWPGAEAPCWRALSPVGGRVPSLVPNRCGLPRLPRVGALARGVRVPGMQLQRGLVAQRWPDHVRRLQPPDLGDGGHDLRQDTDADHGLVHRLLAVRQ